MKKYTYSFRSIMVNHVERVMPGTRITKLVLEMDDTSVGEHTLELTAKNILRNPAWITCFFLSLMLVAAVSAVLFAGIYVGFGRSMEQQSWNTVKICFAITDIIIFAALWIFLSVRLSVENQKRKHVEETRGKGNWKIVDESKWENFNRLLMIAKNRRESEKIIKQ